MYIFSRIKQLILPVDPRAFGMPRSPQWAVLRKKFLKEFPRCWACNSRSNLAVHHKKPFHLFPELELERSNLMTLCENQTLNCHLWIGHGGRWDYYIEDPETLAATIRLALEKRIGVVLP